MLVEDARKIDVDRNQDLSSFVFLQPMNIFCLIYRAENHYLGGDVGCRYKNDPEPQKEEDPPVISCQSNYMYIVKLHYSHNIIKW